ncbi:MAG: SDR family oxidoreductase [Lachnospiraceae bacterium]|jgi:NAD(P)-dependent dehydrogenase (short-subunit alcohol dehydrogenase family)|nr:SDR family oxidoreductase [Lachnospiraceae bacterium]
MGKLDGKVAIITGGSGGIGLVTAKLFLAEGAKVTIVGSRQATVDAAMAQVAEYGDSVIGIPADTATVEGVQSYVKATLDRFGTIDILFNNAGIEGKVAPIVDAEVEDFDRVMAINVRGTWLGLKYVLPVLYAKKSGSVINMSSIGGLTAGPMPVSPYVTSKFAITGMTRIAAVESAPYQVRVNSVHPSPVETRMMRSLESGSGASHEQVATGIPLGRYADPKDVAALVLFLASDDSTFVTGSNYRVDGGMLS